ncbi:MAG TPA: type II toxin-antitoxin system VapC family toxin [Thermomicrobiales bacterium]
MIYLIDSDWIIDHLAGRPDAVALLQRLAGDGFAISIVTYVEAYAGIYGGRDPAASEGLFRRLIADVPVLPISRVVGRRAARERNLLRAQGRPLPLADVLIAATAIHHDLALVTRNLHHYERIPMLKLYRDPATPSTTPSLS